MFFLITVPIHLFIKRKITIKKGVVGKIKKQIILNKPKNINKNGCNESAVFVPIVYIIFLENKEKKSSPNLLVNK